MTTTMTTAKTTADMVVELLSYFLLFLLIFGMSATVDYESLVRQLSNKRAVLTGVAMQFLVMPFLGFVTLKILGEDRFAPHLGIMLLVVTSSPGGSYSNWWCSMFNAELALSVGMTAVSTILCTFMLPANLLLYSHATYGRKEDSILQSVDWTTLFVSLSTVVIAILTGLKASHMVRSDRFRRWANRAGSLSGLSLVALSFLVSTFTGSAAEEEDGDEAANTRLWRQDAYFYVGVTLPCVVGLIVANAVTFRLRGPERVTLSVECCYQNVGIATSVAVSMFDDKDERAAAMNVPLLYGVVEAIVLGLYCLIAWKRGWTKAPPNEPVCKMLSETYELVHDDDEDVDDTDAETATTKGEAELEGAVDAVEESEKRTGRRRIGRFFFSSRRRRSLAMAERSKSMSATEELRELEKLESGSAKHRANTEDTVASAASASDVEEEAAPNATVEDLPEARNEVPVRREHLRLRSSPFVTDRKTNAPPSVSRNQSF